MSTRESATPEGPKIKAALHSNGRTVALGFRLPDVPGVPDGDNFTSRTLRGCGDSPPPDAHAIVAEEWEFLMGSIAAEVTRARYHRLRFDYVLAELKRRRDLLGGPVVGDYVLAHPVYFEAVATLSAARTAVDLIIYAAARRAGKSKTNADSWDASEAIDPKVKQGDMRPTKYDLPEVLILRNHLDWFRDLNLFRNATHHRGWHESGWGYFSKGDTAAEAEDPQHNVMLVPDSAALGDRMRPEEWTYTERRWLDAFVDQIERKLHEVVIQVAVSAWGGSVPADGTLPLEERWNTVLSLPKVLCLSGGEVPVVVAFARKVSAKRFQTWLRQHGLELHGGTLRAVWPTTLAELGRVFLFRLDLAEVGERFLFRLMDFDERGQPVTLYDQVLTSSDLIGPVAGTLSVAAPGHDADPWYVFQAIPVPKA